jgi:putative ABC transport system permease protein
VTGRLLLVCRLLVRDLRRRRTETALLLIAISAATATLTLGLALNAVVDEPFNRTREATAGPDVVAEAAGTGALALAALAPLVNAPGVVAHSGPYPIAFLGLSVGDAKVRAVVTGRDGTPAAVDRPVVTDGTWVRPGGVVIEQTFADALGVHTGDTVGVGERRMRVIGTAVTAARPVYPRAGWHIPNTVMSDSGGLVWVDRADMAAITGDQPPAYFLNLRLADPAATEAWIRSAAHNDDFRGGQVHCWQEFAATNGRLNEGAREAMLVGSWLLTVLAVAGVAGIVAGRIMGQRRRVGLLKAVGAGPAMVAAVHLAEYLVIGLAAAGIGLAVGWFAAPPLFGPSAGFIGSAIVHPPLRVVGNAVFLALAIAAAATVMPVVHAATTDTVEALADAATPPRRRALHIWLSRRLPTALLIGVRINARRPRRAWLVTVNSLITMTALAVVLSVRAHVDPERYRGFTELPQPADARTEAAIFLVAGLVCVLALFNTIVSTWAAVLDARQPLAVARTLGATPGQAGAGLAAAQVLLAVPGVVVGIPFGIELLLLFQAPGAEAGTPASWLVAAAFAVLAVIAALTVVPALATARQPVADALRSAPT